MVPIIWQSGRGKTIEIVKKIDGYQEFQAGGGLNRLSTGDILGQ